ncbi:uncharacterized protein [Palaemon carinicauda]|uniref:uncharacterized protein n=1 Tax=Palaemon carinicauda TaxID=392227 RepID=UPI0035B67AEA
MTMTVLLTSRFLLLAVFFTTSLANPPLTHYYDSVSDGSISRMVGVYRVVDEKSCSCRVIFLPCPVQVQDTYIKKRMIECPMLTRYCCQRATLINLTDVAQKLPSRPSMQLTPPGNLQSTYEGSASSETDVTSEPPFNECSGSNGCISETTGTESVQASEAQTTTVEPPQPETTTVKQQTRGPSPHACSCVTKNECQEQLPFFKDMPKYKFKTSIKCTDPKHVVCCLGEVITPRDNRSPEKQKGNRGNSKSPHHVSIWEALERLIAYFESHG